MKFDATGKEHLLLKDAEVIKRYIHAGKGELVLSSPSGKAHKYCFLEPTNRRDFPEGTIFVYVIHDDRKYYIGMMETGTTEFRRTAKSSFGEDSEAVKGARFIVRMANNQDLIDRTPMTLYQSGRCCKCGRPLTAEDAISTGMGRKCLAAYKILQDNTIPWDGNSAYD